MKKILLTALFLFTLAGSMAGVSLAHATAQDSAGITGADAFSGAVQNSASNGTPTIIDTAASKTATPFGTGPTVDKQMGGIMNWIMTLFAWLVGVAAITLDNVMLYTVVKMGQYVSSISAIGVTWRIFRDIGNIMLIFGFIAAGVTTILDTEMYGFKKALPMLLVGAVFLNFSLFFAEAVIDTGNLFATQFYQQINAGDTAGAKDLGDISTEGISSKIMNQLGLANIYGQALTDKGVFNTGTPTLIAFMSIILFIITAFVLFSLAFVLVARFVFLLMLIIISPIGFAGWAIPKLSKVSHWWWENLFDQTITAPILLLLLYVALAVITDANFLGFGPSGYSKSWLGFIPKDGQTVTNFAGFAGILLSFLVAMGLLIMVVWASKRLGAWGGGWATASAGALSFGLTAWAGRAALGTVIGRGVQMPLRRAAVSNSKLIRYGARSIGFVGNRLQNRTYDIRNAPGVGGLLGGIGIGAGTPSQLTARQVQEKQYGIVPVKAWFRDASKAYEDDAKELERKKKLGNPGSPDFKALIQKMSTDELAELKGIRRGITDFAAALKPAQYNELQKSDKLLQVEKDNLKKAWQGHVSAAGVLGAMSPADIMALDGETVTMSPAMAAAYSAKIKPSQFAEIQKGDKFTDTQKNSLKREWEAQFDAGAAVPIADTLKRFSTEEIASLSGVVLSKPGVIDALGATEFDAIRRKGNLDTDQRRAIHARMMAAPAGTPLAAVRDHYFDHANDVGENRKKYWDV